MKYLFTKAGRKEAGSYIDNIKEKRKQILEAGKDTANETAVPTPEDIQCDIELQGVKWDDPEGAWYGNVWRVTDNYEIARPLYLKYGRDFIEAGYMPKEDEDIQIVKQYANGTYSEMIPGMTVLDGVLSSYWNVLSNDGSTVLLQNVKGGEHGARMNVSDDTCTYTFFLLAPKDR